MVTQEQAYISESDEETSQHNTPMLYEKDNNSKWTSRMKIIAFATVLAYLNLFGTFTVVIPYFPIVANKFGVEPFVTGLILSVPYLASFAASPSLPYLMPIFGPRGLISCSLLVTGLCLMAFGFGNQLPTSTWFIVYSLGCLSCTFAALCLCYASILSITAEEFTNDYGFVTGIAEAVGGLSASVGSVIGGAVFQNFGYLWPTMIWGLLLTATALVEYLMLKDFTFTITEHRWESGQVQQAFKLLKIPGMLLGMEIAFANSFIRVAEQPILALFTEKVLHLNAEGAGFMYMTLWLTYLLTSALVGKLVDKFANHLKFLYAGFLLLAVGFLLLGPLPVLTFLPVGTTWLAVISQIVIGLANSLVFIPSMPYLVHIARADGMEIDLMTTGIISAFFSWLSFIGYFLGPTLVALIADYVDLRWDFSIVGFVALGQSVLIILYAIFRRISCYLYQPRSSAMITNEKLSE